MTFFAALRPVARFFLLTGLALVLVAPTPPPSPVQPISLNTQAKSASGWSTHPAISANGRFVAFTSNASDLVLGDTNNVWDVFVRDLANGKIQRVSVSSTGEQSNNQSGYWSAPAISADGRFVAFTSTATNLVPGDDNQSADIFVFDRQTAQIGLVSHAPGGAPASGWSDWPSISADGRFISFTSHAADLVPKDLNNARDIFLYDRLTGQTELISVSSLGQQGTTGAGWASAVSASGNQVAFASADPSLVSGDTNAAWDVFLRDRPSGKTVRISESSRGEQANGDSGSSSSLGISADGSLVVYQSRARNLVYGDNNGVIDVFVRDWRLSRTWRVSLNVDGNETGLDCIWPAISPDGRFISFTCPAANLVKEDTNQEWDVFIRDRFNHHITRVSLAANGGQGSKPSGYWNSAPLSWNADRVAYTSLAPNLAPKDTNAGWDVFAASFPYLRGLDIVREARAEIGMPYCPRPEPDYRGCPKEQSGEGCGGDYNGFRCGVCTDLVMDAYLKGSGYDLGYALQADLQAHPDRRYRWDDARSANDMALFFQYTGQYLAWEEPFLPGDIAFFDWETDGVVDHVGIVTQTSPDGRPTAIIEALGTIGSNPDGLARELNWQVYHTKSFTGHAR